MQSIKYDTAPVRLSEQEGIDCDTKSRGCTGGRHEWYWQFSIEKGSQVYDTYPFEGVQGACRHQENKVVASRAASITRWNMINFSRDDMMKKLQEGPLVVALDAINDC